MQPVIDYLAYHFTHLPIEAILCYIIAAGFGVVALGYAVVGAIRDRYKARKPPKS